MGNSIKPKIEHAERTGVCNLTNENLTEFPGLLLNLKKNLRMLDLSNNKLPSVPPAIGDFAMLKSCSLCHNRLVSIPEDIGKLKKLESLLLSNNRLQTLPSTLCNLSALKNIVLSNNQLKEFPIQLCDLKHIDMLDLSFNKISAVPEDVRRMHMVEVNLNSNQISHLSEAIAECPRLKVLRIQENCLSIDSFTPKILKESKICLITYEGNVFDNKSFNSLDGYDQYMERFTATKKKFH